jgi:FHS family L-fucose permease-like MFS transporter
MLHHAYAFVIVFQIAGFFRSRQTCKNTDDFGLMGMIAMIIGLSTTGTVAIFCIYERWIILYHVAVHFLWRLPV